MRLLRLDTARDMAGGVALNSVANGRIVRETPIDELYIQPSAGDGGGAIGAALYAYHTILGKPRQFVMEHAYWGQEHDAGNIQAFLKENGIPYERFDQEEKLLGRVADHLQEGKVVGWLQGKFEWGPRALGSRSILADPRRADMDAILEVRNLTKRFHGLLAIDHVSFSLERNEILGLIGPNGAGKTTMISLISGTLEPTEGEVLFEGASIRQLPAYRRGRMGIARTFQVMRPFPGLTVLDNVAVGALFGATGHSRVLGDARDEAQRWLNFVGLDRHAAHRSGAG